MRRRRLYAAALAAALPVAAGSIDAGMYAVLGAAAFFGGTMRCTVSICVIVLEMTATGAPRRLVPRPRPRDLRAAQPKHQSRIEGRRVANVERRAIGASEPFARAVHSACAFALCARACACLSVQGAPGGALLGRQRPPPRVVQARSCRS
jgi:Voltage gated chloride channel